MAVVEVDELTGLDLIRAGLDKLAAGEVDELGHAEDVLALFKERNRMDCFVDQATGRFADSGEWDEPGFRSVQTWIAYKTHAPKGVVRTALSNGRALRHLPVVEAAYRAGEITSRHVQTFAKARNDVTAEQLAEDEEMLVGKASELNFFGHFFRVIEYWLLFADPDAADREYKEKRDRRCVELSKSWYGMWFGSMRLDPISGEIISTELERIYDEMFRADCEETGGNVFLASQKRSGYQRRADALVEMARRSRSTREGSRRPDPLFTVLVDWGTFSEAFCELASGTVLPPSALFPWLDCAWLERVVFGAGSRVLDVGTAQRLFTGATRRGVEVRDRECYHPTCTEPASRCQVDHIQPYSAGGPTTTDNGRLACGFHNRARHGKRGPPG